MGRGTRGGEFFSSSSVFLFCFVNKNNIQDKKPFLTSFDYFIV